MVRVDTTKTSSYLRTVSIAVEETADALADLEKSKGNNAASSELDNVKELKL
jgi:hypothetical protein